jgi:cytochrome c-type biogenesis protein CcmH
MKAFSVSLLLVLTSFVTPVMAQSADELDARVSSVAATIRCPVCVGITSVYAAADEPVGRDLIKVIEQRVQAGDTDAEIRAYFYNRYGEASEMPANASGDVLPLAEVDARTEAISKTLRCVVCQNQSIYDSNAPLAEDMRRVVRRRVLAGDSDAQAQDFLRSRYGDYVLMQPPFQLNTLLLWLGPLILVAFGGYWFFARLRSQPSAPPTALSDADRARIAAALDDKGSTT